MMVIFFSKTKCWISEFRCSDRSQGMSKTYINAVFRKNSGLFKSELMSYFRSENLFLQFCSKFNFENIFYKVITWLWELLPEWIL